MSKLVAQAYHPVNDSTEGIWEGFSWPCLFCGFIWFMYKSMWGWGIIALILAFATFGVSWLIFPFYANALYAKALLDRGYLNESQRNERQRTQARNRQEIRNPVTSSTADELAKLVALKDRGVLSDDEFTKQKLKLLS